MLRLETEEEIKQMLYGIIVDGEIWEYVVLECPEDCKSVHSGCALDCKIKNKWQTYKLGEAINPKYAYRKVNK